MKYLELGMNRKYYSIAWKRYRNEILIENINIIMTVIIILIALNIVYKKLLKQRIVKMRQENGQKGGLV